MVLFLANSTTYLVYVVMLVTVVREAARPEPIAGGYRLVLRPCARTLSSWAGGQVRPPRTGWPTYQNDT